VNVSVYVSYLFEAISSATAPAPATATATNRALPNRLGSVGLCFVSVSLSPF